ncbi:MAG: hypothetical protein LBJ67_15615 [Planctomycetaceae bacterium]|nr:hypothetical protein [Planctomycetaceae bacterium]
MKNSMFLPARVNQKRNRELKMKKFQKSAYLLGLAVAAGVFAMQGPQKGTVDIHGAAPCQSYIEETVCPAKAGKTCNKNFDENKTNNTATFAKNAIGVSTNEELKKCDTDAVNCTPSSGLLIHSDKCGE